MPKQLDFNLQFVKDAMHQWTEAANSYEEEAEKSYSRMRSYLTLYQFRLSDDEKYNIREMLSQSLDNIDKSDSVDNMDNYLDGFCFKLDKSVLPTLSKPKMKPTAIQIQIASEKPQHSIAEEHYQQPIEQQSIDMTIQETSFTPANSPIRFTDNVTDNNDLDYYTMQFFQ